MSRILRVSVVQFNPKVGDIQGNSRRIREFVNRAKEHSPDIIVFPELALVGYSVEDLAINTYFVQKNIQALHEIASEVGKEVVILGFIDEKDGFHYNAGAILHEGKVVGKFYKRFLPNYRIFDEERVFRHAQSYTLLHFENLTLGLQICEDVWHDEPTRVQALNGADMIVVLNASPFHTGKQDYRERMVSTRAGDNTVPILYVNMVGGQDDFVFDGRSFLVDGEGNVVFRAEAFKEGIFTVDILLSNRTKVMDARLNQYPTYGNIQHVFLKKSVGKDGIQYKPKLSPKLSFEEEIYKAILVGLKDYVLKNGFSKVVLGLSGGIDSSLSATLCVDALGSENVLGVWLPTRYNTNESYEDTRKLASNLNIELWEIPIDDIFNLFLDRLNPFFAGKPWDETEENLQARIRANILMAISNKFGHLLISTGNKSEYATGYATIYGDMAGGFAPLKDVYKTWVYKLALWRNKQHPVIPERVLQKPPSAELREGQTDQEKLPPYDLLDRILVLAIEQELPPDTIAEMVGNREVVMKVMDMIRRSEYKRKQAPMGPKVSGRAFYRERRYPNTNGFII